MYFFTGRYFSQDIIFYLRSYIIGGHVLQFILFHWSTCFSGGLTLHFDLSYRRTPLMRTCLLEGMLQEAMYYIGHLQSEYM